MTKVAIKNENITSFGGIYHIMDVFLRLGFEKITESVLGRRGCSGKAFSHGSILGSLFFSYLCGGDCLEDINALTGQFRQRPDTLLPGADTVGARTEGACRKEYCLQERNLWQVLQFQHCREAEHLTFTDDTENGTYQGGQPC